MALPRVSHSPLDEFTLFPRLPPELRQAIWEVALPGPQTLAISGSDKSICRPKVPNLLHVNLEARIIALKTYKLSFASL